MLLTSILFAIEEKEKSKGGEREGGEGGKDGREKEIQKKRKGERKKKRRGGEERGGEGEGIAPSS